MQLTNLCCSLHRVRSFQAEHFGLLNTLISMIGMAFERLEV